MGQMTALFDDGEEYEEDPPAQQINEERRPEPVQDEVLEQPIDLFGSDY